MERISRSKAIRLKCLDCCAGQSAEVRKCELTKCPLWRYRMGKEIKDDNSVENPSFSDENEDEE